MHHNYETVFNCEGGYYEVVSHHVEKHPKLAEVWKNNKKERLSEIAAGCPASCGWRRCTILYPC